MRCVWDNCFSIDGSIRSTCHEVPDLLRLRKREMKIKWEKRGTATSSSAVHFLSFIWKRERERRGKKEVNSIDAHAPFRRLFKSRSRWGMSNCWIIGNSCSRDNSKKSIFLGCKTTIDFRLFFYFAGNHLKFTAFVEMWITWNYTPFDSSCGAFSKTFWVQLDQTSSSAAKSEISSCVDRWRALPLALNFDLIFGLSTYALTIFKKFKLMWIKFKFLTLKINEKSVKVALIELNPRR